MLGFKKSGTRSEFCDDGASVRVHGSMLDEKEDMKLLNYPVCLCPECGGVDTKVIKNINCIRTGATTYDNNSIIFDREEEYVCYECETCGCKWDRKVKHKDGWYDLKEGLVVGVLGALGLAFLIFVAVIGLMLCCCSMEGDPEAGVEVVGILLTLVGIFGTIILIGWLYIYFFD